MNDRVSRALERVEYRLAVHPEDRENVFRLRYRAYLREGAIAPNEQERFTDPVDEHPNCLVVGVHVDGELAGAIRLSISVPGLPPIPTANVFPDTVLPQIEAGRVLVDPTRFVADAQWSRELPELAYLTLRLPWLAMERFNADIMLAAVRPEHYPFYRRLWGNTVVSPPRLYPGLVKPVMLSQLDYAKAAPRVETLYSFFRARPDELATIFGASDVPWLPAMTDAIAPSRRALA
ncbi:MAG TPA: hypothetical protein VGN82_00315 [Bosea sp. (in: a-proteobacteria)]|uniref:N-acyl amino acid synthase FeeM domain-containing protein n=1 Tax=Bosea sp. (in: a-proteobacteria) TaxID=1871050 RepID=UPI002E0EAFE0|nr:hypothetical protein [Bosea sp. (in: a-proteobacteria)]